MSARPQVSVRPINAMVSSSRAHSVQRRSVSASATTNWIQPSQSTAYTSNSTPRRTYSDGTSKGISILILKAICIHTSLTAPILAEIKYTNSNSTESILKSAVTTDFDDLGYNESVPPNSTSSSTSMASRSFQSLAFDGFSLNRTGTPTPLRTLHAATGTAGGHPACECEGNNRTRGASNLVGTAPSQSRSQAVSAVSTISNNFGSGSSATMLQSLISTGHSPRYYRSGSNRSVMSTHPMTALPSMGLLPPYCNATGLHNSHNGGGTSIISSKLNETGLSTSVPLSIDHRIW